MKEYIEKALRTESVDLFKVDNPRVLHAVIGLNTEFGELLLADSDTNLVEEAGDILWYVAIFANEIEASFDELELLAPVLEDPLDLKQPFETILKALDLVKRGLFYGVKTDEVELARCFGLALKTVRAILSDEGFTLTQAMMANIAKLSRRYPDKFSSEAAVNRDLSAEDEVLKKHLN